MKNFLGRIFKTLSYQVNKEIKESLYKNDAFLSSRWGFLEKGIVHWSTHYKKYTVLLVVLSFLVVCNLLIWQPWVKPYVQYIPNWRKLLEWQGYFLGGQLTIIGVVYPLVVGLISILFHNKSAKRVIFPIYQKYSGFLFAGLSGLTLSGFIVTGYFLRATIGDHMYAAVCLTSALWIFSNLLLTTWFFIKTFSMLDEKSREAIVFRFSIHEICATDVRRRIKKLLLENASHCGLLANPDEEIMEVLTYKYSTDNNQEITRAVKRKKTIKDVRFWLINTAIWIQVYILKYKNIQGCTLVIRPQRASRKSNIMIVANHDGFDMNPFVALFIKLSFSFNKETDQADIGLSTVLYGIIGPANDALRDNDAREFSDAVNNIALWHTEVAQSLSFINDDGHLDNWLLLPASGMLGRVYLDEMLGEYYRLGRDAVERIPDNSRFYADMLHLHKRIFASRDTLIKKEIRSLIQGSYYMWYLLIEWRSYNSESRDLRIANKYEDILYDFVGAWESWLMYIEPRSKRTGDINKAYPAFITHLEFTASTAISALRFNNFEAAGWGVDMLIGWLENFSHDKHWSEEYRWRSVLINHYLLLVESEDTQWKTILRGNKFTHSAAFNLAFKNAHLDLRVITACYMLLKPGDSQSDLLAKYVNSLLSGSRIHPTGAIGRTRNNISDASKLLGAYIRHRDYCHNGEGTYGGWLSSILESFGRIYEERRVSGRIYSGWGANDPRSMNRAYVEIGISMSKRMWRLSNDWEEAILSGAFRHMDRESIISDLRDWIKIAKDEHSYILVDSKQLDELKNNFIESVEGVINKIRKAKNQAVVDADIDEERLRKFGIASSAVFRVGGKPEFPLSFFKKLDLDANLSDKYAIRVNIVDYAKDRVALGIETNRAVNEDEWMANTISKNLSANVLRALLSYPPSASHEYSDINNILSGIRDLSESIEYPVLFVGNQTLSNALDRSFHERDLAKRHDIIRQDGFENEYICHIGRCEVYTLSLSDVDYCLLISKELFDAIRFRKVAEDQYVDVVFELNEDSETVGSLKLKYWMKVELTESTPCIKLELTSQEDDLM